MKPVRKFLERIFSRWKQSGVSFTAVFGCVMCFLFCTAGFLHAQDIHFSQFNFSPLNQNPALANLFEGDLRVVGNYRNQWQNVPVRFNTFALSLEGNYLTIKDRHRLGGGVHFFYDRAGDSKMGSLHYAFSQSFVLSLDKKLQHFVSAGIELGGLQRSFSYDKLRFDEQWNGDVFDPSLPYTENTLAQRINVFDVGTGVAYQFRKNVRNNLTVGFSASHLAEPSISFYGDNSSTLKRRFIAHARGQVRVAKRADLVPEFFFQMQDVKHEIDFGLHSKIYVAQSRSTVAVNLGGYYRVGDAMWFLAGLDYNSLSVNLSYDINLSKFTAATNYNGGVEVSVMFTWARLRKLKKPGAVCPAFL